MNQSVPVIMYFPKGYDAILFDLDSVLTQTASFHFVACFKNENLVPEAVILNPKPGWILAKLS